MTKDEQIELKLLELFGFSQDGSILADNQLRILKFMEWFRELEPTNEPQKLPTPVCASGMLLSDYAKKKLEYIKGHSIARDFPNNQLTLEWAGAVLDLLEELKLCNYR